MVAAAVGALTGCTPLSRGAIDTLRAGFASTPELVVTRDDVMARPRYQMRLDSPFGSAIVVLGRVEGARQFWVTSTNQVLVVEHGLIRRTSGFPENLDGTRVRASGSDTDPFAAGLHRIAHQFDTEREVDWMPGYRYGVSLHSHFQRVGIEEREILGERRQLLRVDERVRGEGASLDVINRYWVDPQDGFVFVSEQTPLPGLTLRMTQLRPYRGSTK